MTLWRRAFSIAAASVGSFSGIVVATMSSALRLSGSTARTLVAKLNHLVGVAGLSGGGHTLD